MFPIVSIPFITKFIVCNSIIVQDYSIPVNGTYYTEEINELTKSDVFLLAPCKTQSTPIKAENAAKIQSLLVPNKCMTFYFIFFFYANSL